MGESFRIFVMTPDLPRPFGFWRKIPSDAELSKSFSVRVGMLDFRLIHPHRKFIDGASRQEIPKEKVEDLVNGKSKFLNGETSESVAVIYAGLREDEGWISVGQGEKRLTYFIRDKQKPICVLQQRETPGVWRNLQNLGEVSWREVEGVIAFGEAVASQSH